MTEGESGEGDVMRAGGGGGGAKKKDQPRTTQLCIDPKKTRNLGPVVSALIVPR